jgi:transposase-like protein
MTEKKATCQVCRLRPADVKGKNSKGAPQWRCQTCHDLKNRIGFTNKKQ